MSGKTTKGNPHLRAVLAEVVWVIAHRKDNYLSAHSHRLARRLGKAKAVTAVSHSVLVIIYHVLKDKKAYEDLGADYFKHLDTERLAKQSIKRLEALGFHVTDASTRGGASVTLLSPPQTLRRSCSCKECQLFLPFFLLCCFFIFAGMVSWLKPSAPFRGGYATPPETEGCTVNSMPSNRLVWLHRPILFVTLIEERSTRACPGRLLKRLDAVGRSLWRFQWPRPIF